MNGRLSRIGDEEARTILLDALWAHGSTYRWADHANLRAEITWIEHRPSGDAATDMVWLVDPWGGNVRIERPASRSVAVYGGGTWRVFVDGNETDDLGARAQALGDGRMAGLLLPMPFGLAGPDLAISYVGTRLGPGEARLWQRLLVTMRRPGPFGAQDRTVVEVRKDTHRVDNVLVQWPEPPLLDRPMRVEMVEWWPQDGLYLSRLWRLIPIDEAGRTTGPVLYTVRVKRLEFDAQAPTGTFVRP
jgi:hypothetical protein